MKCDDDMLPDAVAKLCDARRTKKERTETCASVRAELEAAETMRRKRGACHIVHYLQHLESFGFCGLSCTLDLPFAPAALPAAAFSRAAMSSLLIVRKAASTLVAVFALVSKNEIPSFSAKRCTEKKEEAARS
jgi:hypothetical protein